MGFKEILQKMGEKRRQKKEMFKLAEEKLRIQQTLEERQKSANERELNRFLSEEREEQIKEALEFHRKKRQEDIQFHHNPLNTPNITNHTEWEVLREPNLFSKGKMTINENDGSVLRNNPDLMKNNRSLCGI